MSTEKNIICDNIKTICYRKYEDDCYLFIKKYKHINYEKLRYEYNISKHIFKNGINCPQALKINNDVIIFEYKNIKKFDCDYLLTYYEDILEMINIFSNINPPCYVIKWDDYVNRECRDEILSALDLYSKKNEHSKNDYIILKRIYNKFLILKGEVLVHNDFGLYNLGISDDKLICYDFEHVSLGPRNWDFAFLHCLIDPYENYFQLDCFDLHIIEMVISCLLIKIGRCIRKKNDISCFDNLLFNWLRLYKERKACASNTKTLR